LDDILRQLAPGYSDIVSTGVYIPLPPQLIANACKHSYNVASVVAYVPQKHLISQNWQNLLMTHYSIASCTTRTMSYTTCSLNGANFYITLDKTSRLAI